MLITENMPKSRTRNLNVTHGHLGNLASPGEREDSASHHVLMTMMKHNEALCASTKILCSGMVIRCTETSFRGQFSWFLKIVEEHPNGSELFPGYSWWLPDITWIILDRFWDHQFLIISITLVTRKRKASRKTSAPRHDTATKTYLYVCSNFDLLSFIDRRHHHRAHDPWRGHFAHVFWVSGQVTMGAPEGPSGGRRVFRTTLCFNLVALRVSAQI